MYTHIHNIVSRKLYYASNDMEIYNNVHIYPVPEFILSYVCYEEHLQLIWTDMVIVDHHTVTE